MQNGDSSPSTANTSAWKKFTSTVSGFFKTAEDPNSPKPATERTPLSTGTKTSYTKKT